MSESSSYVPVAASTMIALCQMPYHLLKSKTSEKVTLHQIKITCIHQRCILKSLVDIDIFVFS